MTTDIRLSVAIMHHPARHERIPALLRACAPLAPQVVIDPDPTGPPSPLRTAKRAWAAVAEGATHHLVLQDDVVPMRGFASHLRRVVAERPHDGIALFVHWKSPHNAYLVRRAAAAGAGWATLPPAEWTPTLGLLLPSQDARALAAYLARLPDELLDDDDFVTPLCVKRGIRVLATVPHLVEHADEPSLSGYDGERERYATVFDPDWVIPARRWTLEAPDRGLGGAGDVAIELRDSRCVIRFLRSGTGEPVLHPFGWYWHDWCGLIGVDPEQIAAAWEGFAAGWLARDRAAEAWPPPPLALEVWAAAYLLGVDAGPPGGDGEDELAAAVRRQMMTMWVDSGLSPADRAALPAAARAALVECGLAGLTAGRVAVAAPKTRKEAEHDAW